MLWLYLSVWILGAVLKSRAAVPGFPPRQNVLQTFLFVTSNPLLFVFEDSFCPGLATLIWDNGQFLGTTPSVQNFCGLSVRGDTSVIVSPIFTQGQYLLAAGIHNLTVLVYGSPTPNGHATQSLTLKPQANGTTALVDVKMLGSSTTALTDQQAKAVVDSVPKILNEQAEKKEGRSLVPGWVIEHLGYRPPEQSAYLPRTPRLLPPTHKSPSSSSSTDKARGPKLKSADGAMTTYQLDRKRGLRLL
jgi:hypothetical protein